LGCQRQVVYNNTVTFENPPLLPEETFFSFSLPITKKAMAYNKENFFGIFLKEHLSIGTDLDSLLLLTGESL
jgi:hypothetical protein